MTGDRGAAGPNIYSIPPDVDFTRTLAVNILKGHLPIAGGPVPDALSLAEWTILVPTRRAARALTMAFLDASSHATCLLPRIRPLGDIDDDELAAETVLGGAAELHIAPAIAPLQRQFLLAQLILAWAKDNPANELARTVTSATGQALDLAYSLGKLIDGFDNDGVDLDVIKDLFGADLPEHRTDVLSFLDVIRVEYPAALAGKGMCGVMERRSALIRAQADVFASNPPSGPVIAAGSTGSIPATAQLLKQISRLPKGALVLPGLDLAMDEVSWTQLEPHHPQYGLSELLQGLEAERGDVRILTDTTGDSRESARFWLMSEAMRPSATSERWREVVEAQSEKLQGATVGLTSIEAPDRREEALMIALIMRQALKDAGRTVQLVTPDRTLARQVKAELGRWAVDVDDSAGEPLLHTPAGAFMALLVDAAAARFAPRELMALLDHPFALFGLERRELSSAARKMEFAILRGRLEQPDLARLLSDVETLRQSVDFRSHQLVRNMDDAAWQTVADLTARLQEMLAGLEELFACPQPCSLLDLVSRHIRTAEAITTAVDDSVCPLWSGDAGEALSGTLAALAEHGGACPAMLPQDYAGFIKQQLFNTPVRPKHVRHPRIAIHGLLEARLISADVTILGGLNEGVWPAEAEIDPWINRPQRSKINLQLPERRIGLAAHDFVQAASAREVWLTSSRKISGQPAVPSRWLLRMQALLKAAKLDSALNAQEPWLGWALGLDDPAGHAPVKPPQPSPPLSARPNRLSVTRIDRLIKDPYGIYAQYVLQLEPLEGLDQQVSARERGVLVHQALQNFTEKYRGPLPPDAEALLLAEIDSVFRDVVTDASLAAFWWPQMERIAAWYINQEQAWRQDSEQQYAECKGLIEFMVAGAPFTLTGIADRIDQKTDGTLRLIDYKTGQLPAVKLGSADYSAQLDLESHLAIAGSFGGVAAAPVSEALYVRLSGGDPGGELKPLKGDHTTRAHEAFAGLTNLLTEYADPLQPYLAIDAPEREDRPFDFDHLSRWREWGHLLDTDDVS